MYAYDVKLYRTTKTITQFGPFVPTTLTITIVSPRVLPTDDKSEIPPNALCNVRLSRISRMRHNADNQMKAAQQRYKRTHEVKVRDQMPSKAGRFVFVDCSTISAPAEEKWPWKHSPNYFHALLDRFSSS